jgi:hypothetical protein
MKELKFTKELKSQWLEALKSGKYIQGIGKLINTCDGETTKHCCLGVLSEIHPKLEIDKDSDDVIFDGVRVSYDPFSVMFNHRTGKKDEFRDLTSLNDSECDGKYTSVIPLIESIPTVD